MALDQSKVLKISRADYYTAEVGTEAPADLSFDPTTPPAGWEHAGHSSIEDILTSSTEGGETTTLGSIQNASLRQSTTAAIRSFQVNFLQWDTATLKLYYGGNATVGADGSVDVPETPLPSEVAWLAVLRDGNSFGGFYAERASAIAADDVELSDADSLAQLPVNFTPLSNNGKNPLRLYPMKAKAGAPASGGEAASGE